MELDQKDKKVVLGIDFGTTCSCVAINVDGEVQVIPSRYHTSKIPSCVAFSNSGKDVYVGYDAEDQMLSNPEYTIFDIKNIMGKLYYGHQLDAEKKNRKFIITNDGDGKQRVLVSNSGGYSKDYSIEQVASFIFSELKRMAEEFLKIKPEFKFKPIDAVITVPVSFNKSQRTSIFDAATMAGLNILQIVNEPTCALFAYEIPYKSENESKVLVFNLSEANVDVSLVSNKGNVCAVQATAKKSTNFNRVFAKILVDYCLEGLPSKIKDSPVAVKRLEAACSQAVKTLSRKAYTNIDIDFIVGDVNFNSEITKEEFEDLTDFFEKLKYPLKKVIKLLNVEKSEVDFVIISGSGSWVPEAKLIINDYFKGTAILCNINPDEAIALGAATLGGDISRYSLTEEISSERFESGSIKILPEMSPDKSTDGKLNNNERINQRDLNRGSKETIKNNNVNQFEIKRKHAKNPNEKAGLGSLSVSNGEKDKEIIAYYQKSSNTKAKFEEDVANKKENTAESSNLKNISNHVAALENHGAKYNPAINMEEEKSIKKLAGLVVKNTKKQASDVITKPDYKSKNMSDNVNKKLSSAGIGVMERFGAKNEFKKHNSETYGDEPYKPKLYSEALKENIAPAKKIEDQNDEKYQILSISKTEARKSSILLSAQNGATQRTEISCNKVIRNDSKYTYSGNNDKPVTNQNEEVGSVPSKGHSGFKGNGSTYNSESIQRKYNHEAVSGLKHNMEKQTYEHGKKENNPKSKQKLSRNIENIINKPPEPASFSEIENSLKNISEKETFEEVSLDVVLRLGSGESLVLIPKNSKLPYSSNMEFITTFDDQRSFIFEFYAGGRFMADDNFPLGRFIFSSIALVFRGLYIYQLQFCLKKGGLLEMQLYQPKTNFFMIGNILLPLSEFEGYRYKFSLMNFYDINITDNRLKEELQTRQRLIEIMYHCRNSLYLYGIDTDVLNKISKLISVKLPMITTGRKSNLEYKHMLNEFAKHADMILYSLNLQIKYFLEGFAKSNIKPAISGAVTQRE